ncbi:protein kinase super, partial [Ancistrocladus abbreviatus]
DNNIKNQKPWYLKNLLVELMESGSWQSNDINHPSQSTLEILSIIQEARQPAKVPSGGGHLLGSMDLDVFDPDVDLEDLETSGEFAC